MKIVKKVALRLLLIINLLRNVAIYTFFLEVRKRERKRERRGGGREKERREREMRGES